jgi:hypothetical protein
LQEDLKRIDVTVKRPKRMNFNRFFGFSVLEAEFETVYGSIFSSLIINHFFLQILGAINEPGTELMKHND